MALAIRTMSPDEWPTLATVFEEHGGALPHPDLARILVAERDGRLAGFVVIQLVPHIEPIYVSPEDRGSDVCMQLSRAAVAQFAPSTTYYAFAPSEAIEHLAGRVGMTKLPWSIMCGSNAPEV